MIDVASEIDALIVSFSNNQELQMKLGLIGQEDDVIDSLEEVIGCIDNTDDKKKTLVLALGRLKARLDIEDTSTEDKEHSLLQDLLQHTNRMIMLNILLKCPNQLTSVPRDLLQIYASAAESGYWDRLEKIITELVKSTETTEEQQTRLRNLLER